MRRHRVVLLALLTMALPLAGCLGGENEPDPEPEPTPRPGLEPGTDDAALSQSGRWLAPFEGEVPAINMVLLNDGRVLYWSGVEAREDDAATDVIAVNTYPQQGESRILDMSTGVPVITTPRNEIHTEESDLFCSGMTILADGRVLVAGGSDWGLPAEGTQHNLLRGNQNTKIFDPETGNWTLGPDLNLRRWYASVLTDAEGDAITIGGIDHWEQPTEQWASWESLDRDSEGWQEVAGTDQVLPLYPHTYLVPGGPWKGQYFSDTAGALWAPFGEHPDQLSWNSQWMFDAEAGTWEDLGLSMFGVRNYPAHVMLRLEPERDYAPDFIMYGGAMQQMGVAIPFAERTDLATNPPTRTRLPDLETPRWYPLGVLMLDGDVLALGGSLYDNVLFLGGRPIEEILNTEIFDPDTDTWSAGPPMAVERTYHSSTMLLPDGRILVGGHVPDPQIIQPYREFVWDQIVETRFEIYEPGYLFRGERPLIVDAPEAITYGERFTIDVELPAGLDTVLLVHPSATTHTFDTNVRHIELEVLEQQGSQITVRAPPDGFVAAPGHYMVFALSEHADGPVPSEAAWTQLG